MSKHRKPAHQEEEAGEAWLLPYSDLMTLLLAVFIVLFAASKLDAAKAQHISQQFSSLMISTGTSGGASGASDGASSGASAGEHPQQAVPAPAPTAPEDSLKEFFGEYELTKLKETKAELDQKLESEGMANSVLTGIDMRGLVIRLNNAVLFSSGSAVLIKESEHTLTEVADVIHSLDNYIRIEGHTDNVPIRFSDYPSNWELSTARALSVVKLLINRCNYPPEKLIAVGYGEFRPIGDNETPEGREKNRRIDIIILSEKYNSLEEQLVR